jgi:hypothetical protein
MTRPWFVIIALVLVVVVAWYGWKEYPGAPRGPAPELAHDAYPLPSGVEWHDPAPETFSVGSTGYSGVSASSAEVANTMDPAGVFSPFEDYYARKLAALGYQVDDSLAAGGHTGGQTAYRKGDTLILTRFRIDYENVPENAPSECPCDVTLSVFTSQE